MTSAALLAWPHPALADSISFGPVALGTTSTLPVTVNVDAGFEVDTGGYTPPYSLNFVNCGTPGPGTCTADVSFTPTTPGNFSSDVFIDECPVTGGFCIADDVKVTGTGMSLFAGNSTVDFGSIPLNTTSTLPIPLTLDIGYKVESEIFIGDNTVFFLDDSNCIGLATGGTCTAEESFKPGTTPGSFTDTVEIFECQVSGRVCLEHDLAISGTGVVTTPEPSGLTLLGAGMLVMWVVRRNRRVAHSSLLLA